MEAADCRASTNVAIQLLAVFPGVATGGPPDAGVRPADSASPGVVHVGVRDNSDCGASGLGDVPSPVRPTHRSRKSMLMAPVEATDAVLRGLKTLGVQCVRRLWHGLVQLELSATRSDRHAQNRSVLRTAHHRRGPRRPHRARGDQHGVKSLQHRVVAEGVETREQLAFLQAEHGDQGQGYYYFGRPVPQTEFVHILADGVSGREDSETGAV